MEQHTLTINLTNILNKTKRVYLVNKKITFATYLIVKPTNRKRLAHMCIHQLSVCSIHARLDCFKITNGNLSHLRRANYLIQVPLGIKIPQALDLY